VTPDDTVVVGISYSWTCQHCHYTEDGVTRDELLEGTVTCPECGGYEDKEHRVPPEGEWLEKITHHDDNGTYLRMEMVPISRRLVETDVLMCAVCKRVPAGAKRHAMLCQSCFMRLLAA
jgi:predicted nucleic-acid-binding Zn-ribbon protein